MPRTRVASSLLPRYVRMGRSQRRPPGTRAASDRSSPHTPRLSTGEKVPPGGIACRSLSNAQRLRNTYRLKGGSVARQPLKGWRLKNDGEVVYPSRAEG